MSVPSINKERQVKAPDLGRFGFFIKPIVHRRRYGFNEARAVLLLDGNGLIDKATARNSHLTPLLTSKTSVLYSINPHDGKYPSASELLQKLKLGRIAQHKTTTIAEIESEFNDACQQVGIDHNVLNIKTKIGVNTKGNEVYEMLNGRFLINETGLATREGELKDFLYAINEDGELDKQALRECIEAFFDRDDSQFIDTAVLTSFTDIILQQPPKKLTIQDDVFTPISFIERHDVSTEFFKEFYNTLMMMDAEKLQQVRTTEDLLAFSKLVYKRSLSTTRAFQHDLPAPIIAALGKILFHDGRQNLYSPVVGSNFMLSLFLGQKKINPDLELSLCDPFLDSKDSLDEFMKQTEYLYEDSAVDINSIYIDSSGEPPEHDICMSFAPTADTHVGQKIPFSNTRTHSKAHQVILQSLAARHDNGRSIFITAVDDNNKLGTLHESSQELIGYLYRQYTNVMIFDLHKSLLNPSLFSHPVRIFVIGSKGEYSDNFEYQNFVADGEIAILTKPKEFFAVCESYIQEVEDEVISTLSLMDVFEIDSAIADAEAEERFEEEQEQNERLAEKARDKISELEDVLDAQADTQDGEDEKQCTQNTNDSDNVKYTDNEVEGNFNSESDVQDELEEQQDDKPEVDDNLSDSGDSDTDDANHEESEDSSEYYDEDDEEDDDDFSLSDEELGLGDSVDITKFNPPPDFEED